MNLFSNLWDDISKAMSARKGEFDGTSGNETKIDKMASQGKSVNIANPTSYRTFHNVGEGSLSEDDISTGLESGDDVKTDRVGEISSTAIKNIEFDPVSENAKITFTSSDKQYDYPMTTDEFRSFLNADSKGRWVNKEARKYY